MTRVGGDVCPSAISWTAPRAHVELGRERAAPRPGGDHHGRRGDPLATGQLHATGLDLHHLRARPGRHLRGQRPRGRPRIDLQVLGDQHRGGKPGPQLRLDRVRVLHNGFPRQQGARHFPEGWLRVVVDRQGALLAQLDGSGEALGEGVPGGVAAERRRPAATPLGVATLTSAIRTLPSPRPVVPPETSPRSSRRTSVPASCSAQAVAAPQIPAPTMITGGIRLETGRRARACTARCP